MNWLMWRPVIERVTTLQEIETHWDLMDLFCCHEALDLREEAERRAARQPRQK